MTIQRYSPERGCDMDKDESGEFVLLLEAAMDKVEAVAAEREKTAELQAELVAAWKAAFSVVGYHSGILRITADHTFNGVPTTDIASRMVRLGCWERLDDVGEYQCYRPIEPCGSGGSDE